MGIVTTGVQLTKRGFLITSIFQFTFITWYYVLSFVVLQHAVGIYAETYIMAYASFNLVIALTLLLSRFFIHRFDKIRTIFTCSMVIPIVALLILFVSNTILRLLFTFIEGVFLGIGQLVTFTYFWSLTVSEERGRAAAIAGFFSLPFSSLISLMAETSPFFGTIMVTGFLSLGTLASKLLKPEKKTLLTTKKIEEDYHPEKRTILLYSVPWILFCLINATLARNISFYVIQRLPSSLYMFLMILQVIGAGFGALSGGIIADLFGRRLSLGLGLTLYGLSSALGGLVENYAILYFMYAVNGLNWGILWVVYGSVVWGDFSDEESYAKRYSIGLLIFYLATGIGFLLTDQILQIPLITSSLVNCLIIFLSNISLLLAPELLSSDFRRRIKLKLYMNIIKKFRRKLPQNQG